jgi:hypothetical protein
MRAVTTCVVALMCLFDSVSARKAGPSLAALAQGDKTVQAPTDTVAALSRAAGLVRTIGARWGTSMWPGFRPDTVPLLFVLPNRGSYLFNWPSGLPAGFIAVEGVAGAAFRDERTAGAASTGITLADRPTAQVFVSSLELTYLVPTAVHEAFHAFEDVAKRPDRLFGRGERSMLVSSYPVFDVANEAAFAVEGRLLAAALRAKNTVQRRELARQFAAVREARHRRLTPELGEFEAMAELHEGMAQYVFTRTLMVLAGDTSTALRRDAQRELAAQITQLDSLTSDVSRSVRLRFYLTGPAMARLLDDLAPGWKTTLLADNLLVQEILAQASGLHAQEADLRAAAERRYGGPSLAARAAQGVERLKALRRRQVDSLLARPGVQLVVSAAAMSGGKFGLCGFDPQNLFRASPTLQVHMRWVRPCNTNRTFGEFNAPVVQDDSAATMTAVIGSEQELMLTVSGQPLSLGDGERRAGAVDVKLTTPLASYQASKANLTRTGRVLLMELLP